MEHDDMDYKRVDSPEVDARLYQSKPDSIEECDNSNEWTVQIQLDLQDGQENPTRTDFQAAFELPKRAGSTFPVVVDYLYIENNMPYLDRHPDDPLHTVEKREIFVLFKTEEEANFVKRQEWTLYWKYGATRFKAVTPKHDAPTRQKLRDIGQKVLAFKRVTQELLDLGAIFTAPSSGPNYGPIFRLPDCCLDASDFEEMFQDLLKELTHAMSANDSEKQTYVMCKISAFLGTKVKINKVQLMKEIKIRADSWHILLMELARINQSETYFTFKRSFPTENPKWVPIV